MTSDKEELEDPWDKFWNEVERQYNIIMNELFGLKWKDTKWICKRLFVLFMVAMFYGICMRIFTTWDNLAYPQ
tara:strand:- start:283 stop:501 length:219 start_codon:yes stop_codon:yes gene_type:complete